mgnify:CR=1 FL=1
MSDGLAAIWGDRVYGSSAKALLLGHQVMLKEAPTPSRSVLSHVRVNEAQSSLVADTRSPISARNET